MYKKYDFYIASPFFNDQQRERLKFIEGLLRVRGFSFYSPSKECLVKPNDLEEIRQRAFNENLEAIRNSRMIMALTDDKDMGTLFEVGYGYANGIPIIYFTEHLGERPFNLMLAISAARVFINRTDLINWNFKTFKAYKGIIE